MGADQHPEWQAEIASALAWWRDAGVDVELQESPRDWLNAPVLAAQAETPVTEAPAQLPATLAAFATWRTSEAAPEHGWGQPLFAAEGPADAELMVLIEMPERDDVAEGRLLAGAAGRLFDRMLAAIGLDRGRIHLAGIAAARPIGGRIPREATARLAELARHQVALIAPKYLLLLGNAPCHVMLGDLCQHARGGLRPVNQDAVSQSGATMALATFHPCQLIERPQWKTESWKDLQMLLGKFGG